MCMGPCSNASARRCGEARDQGAEAGAPEAVGVEGRARAAPLEGGEPLAQRVELQRGLVGGLLAQQSGVLESCDALDEHGEGGIGGVADGLPRREVGYVALDADRVERGALDRESAEHEPALHEVGGRVLGERERFEAGAQKLERLRSQCGDQAVLGAEQGVDGARRRSRFVGDAAHRQRLGAAVLDGTLRGGEQRGGGALVVLAWPTHAAWQNSVTLLRYIVTKWPRGKAVCRRPQSRRRCRSSAEAPTGGSAATRTPRLGSSRPLARSSSAPRRRPASTSSMSGAGPATLRC